VLAASTSSAEVAILKERLEMAAGLESEAQAHLWPQLSLRASYTQTNGALNGFGMILSQRSFDNVVNFNAPGRLDNGAAAVDFNYRIYAGGADQARAQVALAQRGSTEKQVQAQVEELKVATVRAFLECRQALFTQTTLQASHQALEASLQVAEAAEQAGRLLKAERLNVQVQLAQVEQQSLMADSLVALSQRRLLILMGRTQSETLQLAALPKTSSWTEETAALAQIRPEVMAMKQRVQAAEANLQAVSAGHAPTVDLQASYEYDQGWLRSGSGTNWTAGLVGRYFLFDGHETVARERTARAELRAAEAGLQQVEAEMAFDLARSQLLQQQIVQRLKLAKLSLEQAAESARLTRERFKAGKVLSAELIAVEARLADMQMQLALVEGEQVAAQIALRRSLGLSLFPQ
jgi:outer membrane protein TolC